MSDTTIKKVNAATSPKGEMGQVYLVSGVGMAMRMWRDEGPNEPKPEASRAYETVGYVISGRAELHLEGQMITARARRFLACTQRREAYLQDSRALHRRGGDAPARPTGMTRGKA